MPAPSITLGVRKDGAPNIGEELEQAINSTLLRQFMPDIPGLQRENISVKRDRIVLRYSF